MLDPEPYVSRLRALASHCENSELATELERIADVLEAQHKKIKSTWLWLLGFAVLGFAVLAFALLILFVASGLVPSLLGKMGL
jgi:hypothetical protein